MPDDAGDRLRLLELLERERLRTSGEFKPPVYSDVVSKARVRFKSPDPDAWRVRRREYLMRKGLPLDC